ncbi:MAG: hypothetical protein GYA46_12145 [candidate division Zixibacteria bacterium]|nr:hypothetical protein [candidate division Zixibacteria bacterium]
MQQFRTNITRLRKLIEDKLPEGSDVYGYQGVSKSTLIAALDAAYFLSNEIIPEAETRFEVVSLKRCGSKLYRSLKAFLENEATESDKKEGFDDFLTGLSALVEKTKITYFIVAKQGIRDDEELAKIRAEIDDLTDMKETLSEREESITAILETVESASSVIAKHHKEAEEKVEEIRECHQAALKQGGEIEDTHDAIDGWDKEIKTYRIDFQSMSNQISDLTSKANQNNEKLAEYANMSDVFIQGLKKTSDEHGQLLEEIRQTLEGANRVGMAASFKT